MQTGTCSLARRSSQRHRSTRITGEKFPATPSSALIQTASTCCSVILPPLRLRVPGLHGKPLLIKHRAQTSGDYDPDVTIGSVMNPEWVSPNVMAELSVVHPDGVKAIESGQKTDLSAGYRYTPILDPGTYNGQPYDGRMTDIQFNHVALVEQGRVDGAVVGDHQLEEFFEMDRTQFYRALGRAEDRAVERVAATRRAERECLPYIRHDNRAMALDSGTPEELYMSALTALGVPPQDMEGLELAALKSMFKILTSGASLDGEPNSPPNAGSSSTFGATSPQSTIGLNFSSAPQSTAGIAQDSRHGARGSSPLDAICEASHGRWTCRRNEPAHERRFANQPALEHISLRRAASALWLRMRAMSGA